MRVNGVVSSLVFGVAVSVAYVFAHFALAPFFEAQALLSLYLAGCVVAYASLIGSDLRSSMRNALAAAAGVALVLTLASLTRSGVGEVAIGLSCVLACVRSGLDPETRRTRSLASETTLAAASLGFAAWLVSPGALGIAAGLWGYALVQSLYFMLPVQPSVRSRGCDVDPFDHARSRLLAMLDDA